MGEPDSTPLAHLQHLIEHAAHLLPAQGPITVFIHHNTLHAYEDRPFDDGIREGGEQFGCQPYLSEDRYRDALSRGRIATNDLREALRNDLGERGDDSIVGLTTRFELRLAMLQFPVRTGSADELRWFVAETDALRRVRPEASAAARQRLIAESRRWTMRDLRCGTVPWANELLERFDRASIETWDEAKWERFALQMMWRLCRAGVRDVSPPQQKHHSLVRHRDWLLAACETDSDLLVHDVLIPFCAAFLDQGVSHWQLPDRDKGLLASFCALYRKSFGPPDHWRRGLSKELARLQDEKVPPLECVHDSLKILGVPESEWEAYLSDTFLALRGWAGMILQLEVRGDRAAHPVPPGSLIEFLAVRLLLERFALTHIANKQMGYSGSLANLREACRLFVPPPPPPPVEVRAFLLFRIAQVFGWTPQELFHLRPHDFAILVKELESFGSMERRRIFHHAYEGRFRVQVLDAIALHQRRKPKCVGRPRFQAMFCLDEREESMRRHLEEVAPDAETFGAAGFFSVAIYYRGGGDAHYVPLCPVVITPKHWVAELPDDGHESTHDKSKRARRAMSGVSRHFHAGSRGLGMGAILTSLTGWMASIPLVGRIMFPRFTARIEGILGSMVQTAPRTRLKLERASDTIACQDQLGFSVDEMTDIAERLLRDIGLTEKFSRLVLIHGHGSDSLNNPHKSAYDCGACGGSHGGPNARALAEILNDHRVRERLIGRKLMIPSDTFFVGGFHNTCDDSVRYLDPERVPPSHRQEFEEAKRNINEACDRNAHERCRRFMSAPLTLTPAEAHRHVEARSEDLAQTRPELGHATNAICIVGRRERSRGLYFDRRAFLVSYDPTQDDAEATILGRILGAVVPVCGGINLEYYFSHVDSAGFGCGTKLPHNITALLGVMDGASSDLRTGLPWQMVEIHEPVRLLFIMETHPEALLKIMARNEDAIGKVVRNGWVQFVALDPESNTMKIYRDGVFHPYQPTATQLPSAESSMDWYRGWRDHLEFAEIGHN